MLANEELVLVKGGGLTATLLNSLSRYLESVYRFGQALGSSIRRIISKKVCKI